MTIKRNDPVREAFSGRSTGNKGGAYYDSKGIALCAFDAVLKGFGYCLDCDDPADYNGDSGRALHRVCDENDKVVGCANFSWYRMPSGSYEFIGYLA